MHNSVIATLNLQGDLTLLTYDPAAGLSGKELKTFQNMPLPQAIRSVGILHRKLPNFITTPMQLMDCINLPHSCVFNISEKWISDSRLTAACLQQVLANNGLAPAPT